MRVPSSGDNIEAVRRFNRFYTQRIGVLHEGLLGTEFSLAEGHVLYELAHRDSPTASDLGRDLGLDPSYLSRILGRFEKRGLLRRVPATDDARRRLLALTARGRKAFAPLDARSRAEIGAMLAPLADAEQTRLVGAMDAIESALVGSSARSPPYRLRPHHAGDIGWVVSRHGALYTQEYGWSMPEGDTRTPRWIELAVRMFSLASPRFPLDGQGAIRAVLTPNDLGTVDFHGACLEALGKDYVLHRPDGDLRLVRRR